MQIFKENVNRRSLSILKDIPSTIEIHQGNPGISRFRNNEEYHIGCLSCQNPRCMFLSDIEVECDLIEGFPYDKSLNSCPVDAIEWDGIYDTPKIDYHKCINCGICVSRCPVGALYFSNDEKLMVNTEKGKYIVNKDADSSTQMLHSRQIAQLLKIPRTGISLRASDRTFENIYGKLFHIRNNYHNIIGRNLLIALGCRCSMRRVGDVYTRMDAVYSSPARSFGAVKIEFGKDTLDAFRGILDDIAVLNVRYGVHKKNNKAIVICLQLPNARQGYWQVVRDVKIVEGLKIGTITIGALMLLLWHRCIFEPELDRYYIDYDNMDLRHILCTQLDCNDIELSDRTLGILEPMK